MGKKQPKLISTVFDHPVYEKMRECIFSSEDGVDVHYWLPRGPHEGQRVVLFLHGLTGNHSGFTNYIAPFLEQGYYPFMLDMRGHGKSTKLIERTQFSMDLLVRDIVDICHKEGFEKIDINSHCFGSLVAFFLHDRHPDLLRSLVLMEPYYVEKGTTNFKSKRSLLRPVAKPFLKLYGDLLFRLPHLRPVYLYPGIYKDRNRPLSYFFIRDMLSNPLRLIQDAFRVAYDTHAEFERILDDFSDLPLLFIGGERDSFVPYSYVENLYNLLRSKTKASIHMIKKTSHTLPVSHPELLSGLLLEFFAAV